jgi:hypothetical protein
MTIRPLKAASLQELRSEAEICMTAGIRRVNAWRTWTQILCTNLEALSSGELQSSGERDNRLASTPRFASHNCPTPATPTFESPRRRFTTRRPHTRSPPSTPKHPPTHTPAHHVSGSRVRTSPGAHTALTLTLLLTRNTKTSQPHRLGRRGGRWRHPAAAPAPANHQEQGRNRDHHDVLHSRGRQED